MTGVALLHLRTYQLQEQLLLQDAASLCLLVSKKEHHDDDDDDNDNDQNNSTSSSCSSLFDPQTQRRRRQGCRCNYTPSRVKSVLLVYLLTYFLLIGDALSLSLPDGSSSSVGGTFASPSFTTTTNNAPPHDTATAASLVVTSKNKNNGKVLKHYWWSQQQEGKEHQTSHNRAMPPPQQQSPSSSLSLLKRTNRKLSLFFLQELPRTLSCTFLPIGYPHSTPPGYLSFAVWSSIQDLCTVARGVVATASVLQGVGVGSAQASAMAAVLQFLVRDGCGRLATLLFTAAAASRFRTNIKQWRLFADIMVDIGITCEVIAQYFSNSWFLFWICVGNMCKAVCGVAAGACAGAIQVHWASGRGEEDIKTLSTTTSTTPDGSSSTTTATSSTTGTTDVTDIAAKFGAQNTVTGTIGLLLAAVFSKYLSNHHSHIWTMYILLTVLHIYANIRCMRWIAFDYLNTSRLKLAITHFLLLDNTKQQQQQAEKNVILPSRLEMSFQEPLFFSFNNKIILGVSFDEIIKIDKTVLEQEQQEAALSSSLDQTQPIKWYWIGQDHKNGRILVAFREGISPLEQAKAYFHATLILHNAKHNNNNMTWEEQNQDFQKQWNAFCSACQAAGWNLNKTDLYTRGYEVSFDTEL